MHCGTTDKTRSKAKEFVTKLYRNAPILGAGARDSTTTFVQNEIGDVLITWENEAFLAIEQLGKDKYEMVVPSISVLAEPPVTRRRSQRRIARGDRRGAKLTCSTCTRRKGSGSSPSTTTGRTSNSTPTRKTSRGSRTSSCSPLTRCSAAGHRLRPSTSTTAACSTSSRNSWPRRRSSRA